MQEEIVFTKRVEVADVLRQTNLGDLSLGVHEEKTLRALQQCRTVALGGHVDACDGCGNISISYNSCRNRHCPKCQGHKRAEWIDAREADLLPCTYYHLVFTLPQELNLLALQQPKPVYDALFSSAWRTLQQFGATAGVQLGMIAILHSWPVPCKANGRTKFIPASTPALHCTRWRHGCTRPLAKAIAQQ